MQSLVLHDHVSRWRDDAAFTADLASLPLVEQARLGRKRRETDKRASTLGKILLRQGLEALGFDPKLLLNLQYTPSGKPYLEVGPSFSITHAEGHVVVALTAEAPRVGVDCELEATKAKLALDDLEETMTTAQWQDIHGAVDPSARYLELWTMKESIVKLTGRGLATPLGEIEGGADGLLTHRDERFRVSRVGLAESLVCHVAVKG